MVTLNISLQVLTQIYFYLAATISAFIVGYGYKCEYIKEKSVPWDYLVVMIFLNIVWYGIVTIVFYILVRGV